MTNEERKRYFTWFASGILSALYHAPGTQESRVRQASEAALAMVEEVERLFPEPDHEAAAISTT